MTDLPPHRIAQLDRIEAMLQNIAASPVSLLSAKEKGQSLAEVIDEYGHGSPEYKSFVAEMNSG